MNNSSIQKIAVLSVHTCPLAMLGGKKTGGMNVYVRDFCRELGRRGVQVDVFTRSQDSCVPMVVHDLGENARVIHIQAGPEYPLPVPEVAQYLDDFTQGVWEFALVEGIEYDLIHSHYWLSGLVAGKLRTQWQRPIPIVQMFHTLGHMKNKIALDEFTRAPQGRINGETVVIQEIADTLIAATPAEEQQLIDLYGADPAKITIMPPGVDLARFHHIDQAVAKERVGIGRCKKNILFAGRIEPLKGIDTLLRAISILEHKKHTILERACVTIVGGDPKEDTLDSEMGRLQQLCGELNLDQLVTFVGSKDQMMLPNYYAASEMVVMPSHYESFGLVALEAMAMGTPVIASEVGGLAHLIKDGVTGYHVPSRDAHALARRICELLDDPARQKQMGECAAFYAQAYAWECIVDQAMGVYAALLEDSAERIPSFSFQTPTCVNV